MASQFKSVNNNEKEMGEVECSHDTARSSHCKIICTECDTAWSCRICHDEADSSHEMDRFAVVKISCNKCETVQDKQSKCVKCGIEFGKYSCLKCSIFDDDEKDRFHCDRCDLCRTGGREKFLHCDTCEMCLPASTFDKHKCQDMPQQDCSKCMESMEESRDSVFVPKCSHLVHFACYEEMVNNNIYKCPVCQIIVDTNDI